MPFTTILDSSVANIDTSDAPTLNNWEYQLKSNGNGGVLLNGSNAVNFYDLEGITGVGGAEARLVQVARDGGHGAYGYAKYLDSKTVAIDLTAYDIAGTGLQPMLDTLARNWLPDDKNYPLYYKLPGVGIRVMFGKPLGIKYDLSSDNNTNKTKVQCQLFMEDPRHYSLLNTQAINYPTIVGEGIPFPFTFPFTFGGTLSGGSLSINNAGSIESEPLITMTNRWSNARITNGATGHSFLLPFSTNVGDIVEIDCAALIVKKNGVDISNQVIDNGAFIYLVPGANNISISATTADADAQVIFKWRDAWYQG